VRAAGQRGAPAPMLGPRLVALVMAGSLVGLGLALVHRPDGAVTITVLDVGQGDAILVEGGRGGRMLVDGGPDPDRLLIELDARLPPWDRRIDLLVLTHPHEDHVAGLALLLERYAVGRVFEAGMRGPGPGYAAWGRALAGEDGPTRATLATGDRFRLDEIGFTVLWPDPGRVPEEPPDTGRAINDVSIVLLGEVDGRRFLLTGDVEDDVDPVLAGRGIPPIDILKVAHHGSGSASSSAFVDALRPMLAVVSAGADNPYGHPAPTTIGRLSATGARVLRTDVDGAVEIRIDAGRIAVRTAGARAARAGPPTSALDGSRSASVMAVPTARFLCAVPSAG
jgi:competence protein ComEC